MPGRAALGVDVGTSGLKAIAIDGRGKVLAIVERSYQLLTPRPGWTEQRPEDWWEAARAALTELAARVEGYELLGLGLSGQMHGMVPLGEDGEVLRPALLWNDQRTAEAVAEIESAVPAEELIRRTGNPAITGFQLPKVLWLRRAEPERFARLRHVLFPKDYLGYRLTGELAAEPSDASGSNAFNINAKAWDGDVLAAVGLDSELWPAVVPSDAMVGGLLEPLAEQLDLPAGLPVVAGAGDNAAAAYGLGLSSARPRLGSVSLGTSGVIFAPLAEPRPDPRGRVHLFCHADGGYHLLGVTLAAAGSLRWLRDTFAPGRSFSELAQAAGESAPGANGVTFKPYLAGERTPHLDPGLRGSFHGLSLATTFEDVLRAVLEGVAFSLREALAVISPLAPLERALALGGGAASPVWLGIVADVLELPLGKLENDHGAAYGAARLALGEAGAEAAVDEPQPDTWHEPSGFEPYAEAYQRYLEAGPPS